MAFARFSPPLLPLNYHDKAEKPAALARSRKNKIKKNLFIVAKAFPDK
jgi:hypothetical protein